MGYLNKLGKKAEALSATIWTHCTSQFAAQFFQNYFVLPLHSTFTIHTVLDPRFWRFCCNKSQSAALLFGYTFSLRTSKRARETERATNRSQASAVSMVCDCLLIHQFELN
jgi:hypothetical protein